MILLHKFLIYGCIGILVEFFFTSAKELLKKNWRGTGYSYIWMPPIYGTTALLMELISKNYNGFFGFKALMYVGLMYTTEAISGFLIKKLTGSIPWEYPKTIYTLNGLIQPLYFPFWLTLALFFDYISVLVNKISVVQWI